MTFTGPRFEHQQFSAGQRGGLQNLPYCGILSGLVPSLTTAAANFPVGGNAALFGVSAGEAKFDGVRVSLATAISAGSVTVTPQLAANRTNRFELFVTPTRRVPALTAIPATGNEGDMFMHVVDKGSYLELLDVFRRVSGSWVRHDQTYDPPSQNNLGLPLNDIGPTLGIANFTTVGEKPIYKSTAIINNVPNKGSVLIRKPLSILLANVEVVLIAGHTFGTTAASAVTVNVVDNRIVI